MAVNSQYAKVDGKANNTKEANCIVREIRMYKEKASTTGVSSVESQIDPKVWDQVCDK